MRKRARIVCGESGTVLLSFVMLAGCAAREEPVPAQEAVATSSGLTLAQRVTGCAADPRVQLGLVSSDVCVGADLFFRDAFGGNGRTCGSCHPADHNYTIDPDYIGALSASDALFVAEQQPALAQLEKPALMRQYGLIVENVDDTSDPTNRFVMRSVPHCLSLGTSVTAQAVPTDGTTRPPNQRTGWSGDGAPNQGELRDFQTGAVVQHYTKSLNRAAGTDFTLPTSDELDKIVTFTSTIGRTNELTLANLALSDSGAETGRLAFLTPANRCNACHGNAGANVAAGFNRNFNTGVERSRVADLNTQNIPFDGGFGGPGVTSFNFDASGDGILDSYGNGSFNTPPLIEAADTGPFFHTNAFTTIESAITFYTTAAFSTSPAGAAGAIVLSPTDIGNLGRFLRVLNAAFNCQMAVARINADVAIIGNYKNRARDLEQQLASLALAEVNDALADLAGAPGLNTAGQTSLAAAKASLSKARAEENWPDRLNEVQAALASITAANSGLSATPTAVSALTFTMGAGTLMF